MCSSDLVDEAHPLAMRSLDPEVHCAGKAFVLGELNQGASAGKGFGRSVGGAIVDDNDLVGGADLGFEEVEEAQDKVTPLPGGNNNGDCDLGLRR